jgi:hypothetical protein
LAAAFYYPRYGGAELNWRSWRMINQHRIYRPPQSIAADQRPLLGPYDCRDPEVADQHLAWAEAAGLDVLVICRFFRDRYEDDAIQILMERACSTSIKLCFVIGAYLGRTGASVVDDINEVYRRFGAYDSFLWSHDPSPHCGRQAKGVFFLWATHLREAVFTPSMDGPPVPAAYWRAATDELHAAATPSLLIANPPMAYGSVVEPIEEGGFDGMFNYTHPKPTTDFSLWAHGLPPQAWYVPCVLPGYSAWRIGYDPKTYVSREGGKTYSAQWRLALEPRVVPSMVVITSFNEWNEGTQIEPAKDAEPGDEDHTRPEPDHYVRLTRGWTDRLRRLRWPRPSPLAEARCVMGKPNQSSGLTQIDVDSCGAIGRTAPIEVQGVDCRRLMDRYTLFWVDNDFFYAGDRDLEATVTYCGRGPGTFRLEYDGRGPIIDGAHHRRTEMEPVETGYAWRTVSFDLPQAHFGNRQKFGSDFRIARDLPDRQWLCIAEIVLRPKCEDEGQNPLRGACQG